MLPFVLHLLGDLLEIGSRSCELRRLSVLQQDFQGPQRAPFLRTSSTLQMLCIDQVSSCRWIECLGSINISHAVRSSAYLAIIVIPGRTTNCSASGSP